MNLWESAIMSGMVPLAGRHPLPSRWTNSFIARSITQKEGLWHQGERGGGLVSVAPPLSDTLQLHLNTPL